MRAPGGREAPTEAQPPAPVDATGQALHKRACQPHTRARCRRRPAGTSAPADCSGRRAATDPPRSTHRIRGGEGLQGGPRPPGRNRPGARRRVAPAQPPRPGAGSAPPTAPVLKPAAAASRSPPAGVGPAPAAIPVLAAWKERACTSGGGGDLLVGLQLTHSGRYCRPHAKDRMEPRIAYHHPMLDARVGVQPDDDRTLLSDGELDDLLGDDHHPRRRLGMRAEVGGAPLRHCGCPTSYTSQQAADGAPRVSAISQGAFMPDTGWEVRLTTAGRLPHSSSEGVLG